MKNFKEWLSEAAQSDDQIKAELIKHINKKISAMESKNAKAISDASKIVDVKSIIEESKKWLIKSVPTVMTGLKSGNGGDAFAAGFVAYVTVLIKKELDSVGFLKRNTAKLLAPNKATYLSKAKQFNATPFIGGLKECLDLGMAVGWMEGTKPYENQLWKWSNSVGTWIDKNEKLIKEKFANTFSDFLYD